MNNTGMFNLPRAAGTIVLFIVLFSYAIPRVFNPSIAGIESLIYAFVLVGLIIGFTSMVWPAIESEL